MWVKAVNKKYNKILQKEFIKVVKVWVKPTTKHMIKDVSAKDHKMAWKLAWKIDGTSDSVNVYQTFVNRLYHEINFGQFFKYTFFILFFNLN